MRVLNIEVDPDLLRRWVTWLAPERQPFLATADQIAAWSLTAGERSTDPQTRDTIEVYELPPELSFVWLDEAEFMALPKAIRVDLVRAQVEHGRGAVPTVRAWQQVLDDAKQVDPVLRAVPLCTRGRMQSGTRVQRATAGKARQTASASVASVADQAGGHRFVWWPSLLDGVADVVLPRLLTDIPPCRDPEVSKATWQNLSNLLPGARAIAGTFPIGSGPNCFGTVMAAAGLPDAADVWMLREPFEEWLADATIRGGRDEEPGTVLVWRSPADGLVQHAAVTLGDGWALNKRSQSWMNPRMVYTVADVLATSRTPGWRLTRHTIR